MLVYNLFPRQRDFSARGAGINKNKKGNFLYPEVFVKISQWHPNRSLSIALVCQKLDQCVSQSVSGREKRENELLNCIVNDLCK